MCYETAVFFVIATIRGYRFQPRYNGVFSVKKRTNCSFGGLESFFRAELPTVRNSWVLLQTISSWTPRNSAGFWESSRRKTKAPGTEKLMGGCSWKGANPKRYVQNGWTAPGVWWARVKRAVSRGRSPSSALAWTASFSQKP